MGKAQHPDFETLSALADGELAGPDAALIRAHTGSCAPCQAELGAFERMDALLAAPGTAEREWEGLKEALAALPAGRPSRRIDQALAAIVLQPAPRVWPPAPLGIAARVAVAAAIVLALVVGTLPGGVARRQAQVEPGSPAGAPALKQALVAAVQTSVLYSRTNTLYVIESAQGKVSAYDASTNELRARIAVGGTPTAITLNGASDLVAVLDSSTKTLSEIDPGTNKVVGRTQLSVPGTPTGVQADGGRYLIASIPDAARGGGDRPLPTTAATPAASPAGQVTLVDGSTKKTLATHQVDIAPRLVVPDPRGKFTLLVSPDATSVVDPATFVKREGLKGGIAAAFDARAALGWFAILSASGGESEVSFFGDGAPAAVRLEGKAQAITALPDGGFGVLLGKGDAGKIVLIDPAGRAVSSVDVSAVGPTLDFDARGRRFTVTRDGVVASVVLPESAVAAASPEPRKSAAPSASPSPAPSAAQKPEPSPTPLPIPKQPAGAVAVSVPDSVVKVGQGLYKLPLPSGRNPVLTAGAGKRMWYLDASNGLNVLNVETGTIFYQAQLPADAVISAMGAGERYVYATDLAQRRLYVYDAKRERLAFQPLAAAGPVSAIAVTPKGDAWMAVPVSTQLLGYDASTRQFSVVNVDVAGLTMVASDANGTIWFSNGSDLGSYESSPHRVGAVAWSGGHITALVVDRGGVVWAGTSAGEVWTVSPAVSRALELPAPVVSLTVDPGGQAWYLARSHGESQYGRVGSEAQLHAVGSSAVGLAANSQRRAWLADPAGGMFLRVEP